MTFRRSYRTGKEQDQQFEGTAMGAQTTPGTTDGHSPKRAGRGRGVLLGALTAALFSLPAGAAAASPVETPPSPQHLNLEVPVSPDLSGEVCDEVSGESSLPVTDDVVDGTCQNVNGWQ